MQSRHDQLLKRLQSAERRATSAEAAARLILQAHYRGRVDLFEEAEAVREEARRILAALPPDPDAQAHRAVLDFPMPQPSTVGRRVVNREEPPWARTRSA